MTSARKSPKPYPEDDFMKKERTHTIRKSKQQQSTKYKVKCKFLRPKKNRNSEIGF